MIRKRIYFSGRVQGVGFRYTAKMKADSLGLTGYVMNLSDGRVLMEAQGESLLIEKLVASMNTDSYIQVTEIEAEEIPINGNEASFSYRF